MFDRRITVGTAATLIVFGALASGCRRGKEEAATTPAGPETQALWMRSPYTPLQGKFVRVTFSDGLTAEAFLRRASPEIITCEAWGMTFDVVPEKVKTIEEIETSTGT